MAGKRRRIKHKITVERDGTGKKTTIKNTAATTNVKTIPQGPLLKSQKKLKLPPTSSASKIINYMAGYNPSLMFLIIDTTTTNKPTVCQIHNPATKDKPIHVKTPPVAQKKIIRTSSSVKIPIKDITLNKNRVISDFAVQKFMENSNVRDLLLKDMKRFSKGDPKKIFDYARKVLMHFHDKSLVTFKDGEKFIANLKYKSLAKELDTKLLLSTPSITTDKLLEQYKNCLQMNGYKTPYVNMTKHNMAYAMEKNMVNALKKQFPKTWEGKIPSTVKFINKHFNQRYSIDYMKKYSNIKGIIDIVKERHKCNEETAYKLFMKSARNGEYWKALRFRDPDAPRNPAAPKITCRPTNELIKTVEVEKSLYGEELLTFSEFVKFSNILELITYILDDVEDPDVLNEVLQRNYDTYYNYPDRRNYTLLRELVFKKRPMESRINATIGKQSSLNEIINIITISSDESDTEAMLDEISGGKSNDNCINNSSNNNNNGCSEEPYYCERGMYKFAYGDDNILYYFLLLAAHTSTTNFITAENSAPSSEGSVIFIDSKNEAGPSTSGINYHDKSRKIGKLKSIDGKKMNKKPKVHSQPASIDSIVFTDSEKINTKILYRIFKRNSNINSFLENSIRKQFAPTLAEKHLQTLSKKTRKYFNHFILHKNTYPTFIEFTNGWTAELFTELQKKSEDSLYDEAAVPDPIPQESIEETEKRMAAALNKYALGNGGFSERLFEDIMRYCTIDENGKLLDDGVSANT